ncbi:putative quinol monooxygenase [Burkholderia cenocepacia]|uniref:putative quinol monooxygenase n=1 Tax=Burkholderia cenocepacia TaxID=95486 RepID=UPI0021AB3CCF|nr:putative quinol monooxygenase [Burkholderia cenocepacia]
MRCCTRWSARKPACATQLVEPSRQEHGNLRYELLLDEADPSRFVFIEQWENEKVQATHHNESPHIQAFQTRYWNAIEKVEVFRLNQIA